MHGSLCAPAQHRSTVMYKKNPPSPLPYSQQLGSDTRRPIEKAFYIARELGLTPTASRDIPLVCSVRGAAVGAPFKL